MGYEFYTGVFNIFLLFLSGFIAAIFGPSSRYLFFIAGGALGISATSSGWYWGILIFSILVSFWMYGNSMKKINNGEAITHVIHTVANSTSAYFTGAVVGLVAALVKHLLF